jgi:hypothetical protein
MDTAPHVDPRRTKVIETVRRALALAADQPETPEGKNAAKAAVKLRKIHRIRASEIDPRTAFRDPAFEDAEARRFVDLLAALANVPLRWSTRKGTAWLGGDKANHVRLILAFTESYPWIQPRLRTVCIHDEVSAQDAWTCVHLGVFHQARTLGLLSADPPGYGLDPTTQTPTPPPESTPPPPPEPPEPPSRKKQKAQTEGTQVSLNAYMLGVQTPGLDFLLTHRIEDEQI